MADYAKLDKDTTAKSTTEFEMQKGLVDKMKTESGPAAQLARKLGAGQTPAINATTSGTIARGESLLKTTTSQLSGGLGAGKGGGMYVFGGVGGAGFEGSAGKINRRLKPIN